MIADDGYLIESIKDPGAKLVAGFDLPMPADDLSEDQIDDIIAYIRDLSTPP